MRIFVNNAKKLSIVTLGLCAFLIVGCSNSDDGATSASKDASDSAIPTKEQAKDIFKKLKMLVDAVAGKNFEDIEYLSDSDRTLYEKAKKDPDQFAADMYSPDAVIFSEFKNTYTGPKAFIGALKNFISTGGALNPFAICAETFESDSSSGIYHFPNIASSGNNNPDPTKHGIQIKFLDEYIKIRGGRIVQHDIKLLDEVVYLEGTAQLTCKQARETYPNIEKVLSRYEKK